MYKMQFIISPPLSKTSKTNIWLQMRLVMEEFNVSINRVFQYWLFCRTEKTWGQVFTYFSLEFLFRILWCLWWHSLIWKLTESSQNIKVSNTFFFFLVQEPCKRSNTGIETHTRNAYRTFMIRTRRPVHMVSRACRIWHHLQVILCFPHNCLFFMAEKYLKQQNFMTFTQFAILSIINDAEEALQTLLSAFFFFRNMRLNVYLRSS